MIKTYMNNNNNNNLLIFINLFTLLFFAQILWSQQGITQDQNANDQKTDSIPQMEFEQRHVDLGKVKRGENIRFSYPFTNKGKVDLTIDFVSGCDCTELDWPLKTFKPGESGTIEVVFLSSKKEKSETVEIDVLLKNVHPVTKHPIIEFLSYSYEF